MKRRRATPGVGFAQLQFWKLQQIPCSSIETEHCLPDTSLIVPCSDSRKLCSFLQQDVEIRENGSQFRGQKIENSLYISLLAGNSGGERLAPDCALRQQVLAAANFQSY
jgi:hypothetical protein